MRAITAIALLTISLSAQAYYWRLISSTPLTGGRYLCVYEKTVQQGPPIRVSQEQMGYCAQQPK